MIQRGNLARCANLVCLIALTSCGGGGGGGGSSAPPGASIHNLWAWESGAKTGASAGSYGTQGTPAASNAPPARQFASSWRDASGNFWLFGGQSYESINEQGLLDDLWRYSPSTGQWTWMNGSSSVDVAGVYGTQGSAAAANVPGARYGAASWTDPSGNLWLFGGVDNTVAYYNDLWMYSPATGQWTWVGGANTPGAAGSYGTRGSESASNVPGARTQAAAWSDNRGNLWLFGGVNFTAGYYNDLWKYDLATGQWAWMSGSQTPNSAGVYGMQGAAAAANVPPARFGAATWTGTGAKLWLFAGQGIGSNQSGGLLNDLWVFDSASGQWTWVSGTAPPAFPAVSYGSQGVADPGNHPSSRVGAVSWTDAAGLLWMFGGDGDFTALENGVLNDLWQFNPATGLWTWVGGTNALNQEGVYGIEGTPAASNVPAGRYASSAWIGGDGDLWLFGGTINSGLPLNDLWKFIP